MQLLLYKLKFPGNVGAIYRLAYNFQVEKIWTLDCVGPDAQDTPKVGRHIPIEKVTTLDFMNHFEKDIVTVALEQSQNDYFTHDTYFRLLKRVKDNLILAVGNEAQGIPVEDLKKFDGIVSLKSEKPQSYNVSHALAIALYKIYYAD